MWKSNVSKNNSLKNIMLPNDLPIQGIVARHSNVYPGMSIEFYAMV